MMRMEIGMETPPKLLVAFDPGLATGYAFFDEGRPSHLGDIRGMEKMDDFLVNLIDKYGKPDVVVIEDFRLWSWKAKQQAGSKMEASKVIGKIELWAKMNKIPITMQKPQDKDMGVVWSKLKIPLNHDKSHHIVAYNHAVFFLVTHGMMLPMGMENAPSQKN
jgi:hypothetical protein